LLEDLAVMKARPQNLGSTLVELAMVNAIVGILTALSFPRRRERSSTFFA
jgi:Tfp pilus assembly protein PilE